MPRFDAHESSPSRLAEFRTVVIATAKGNPGVVLSTLFLTLVAMLSGTALISIAVAVPSALRNAFVSIPVLVFAVPGATRSEVESLDLRLKALPMVADVSARSKEAALAALIEAGLPAAGDGRNPLPDVWTLRLRLLETRVDSNFVTVVVGARDAIASLPAVERVKFDEGWVILLDRWARGWSAWGMPILAGCLLVGAAGTMLVYGLFSRSLRLPQQGRPSQRKSVLAFVSFLVVTAASLVIIALCALFESSTTIAGVDLMKPIADQAGLTLVIIVASIGAVTLVCAWLGALYFTRR